MFSQHFYHQHTRRAVTVFGTLFNDITVVKRDNSGNIQRETKVPLSYGPRQKFLSRISEEPGLNDPKLAIKLPRMSFEITSFEYDASTTLQTSNRKTISSGPTSLQSVFHPANYLIGFELNILAKHMDDALQILEQIIPYFKPEYTVTVKELDGAFTADMPFTLNSVSMSDDYEGEYLSRRAIIYTLTFTTRARYYGPVFTQEGVIKETRTTLSDADITSAGESYTVETLQITPTDASPSDDFTIIATYDPITPSEYLLIAESGITGTFTKGEAVSATISGATGVIQNVDTDTDTINIIVPDDRFVVGDVVTGSSSGAFFTVGSYEEVWNTLQ